MPFSHWRAVRLSILMLCFGVCALSACSKDKFTESKGTSTPTQGPDTLPDEVSKLESSIEAKLGALSEATLTPTEICDCLDSRKTDNVSDKRTELLHSRVQRLSGDDARKASPCLRERLEKLSPEELKGAKGLAFFYAIISNTNLDPQLRALALEKGAGSFDETFLSGLISSAAVYPDIVKPDGEFLKVIAARLKGPIDPTKPSGWSLIVFLQAVERLSHHAETAALVNQGRFVELKAAIKATLSLSPYVRFAP